MAPINLTITDSAHLFARDDASQNGLARLAGGWGPPSSSRKVAKVLHGWCPLKLQAQFDITSIALRDMLQNTRSLLQLCRCCKQN